MAHATADHPPRPTTPAGRVAALADALESRARALAPLLDMFREYLEAVAPGRSRPAAEHLLELLDVGLWWRSAVPAPRRARAARAGGEELARLASLLSAVPCPEATLARLRAWRDFALAADVPEVLSVADGLCSWFEQSSRVLGPDLSGDALELVRAEVLGRSLRRRPPVFAPGLSGRPVPRRPGPAGGAAPAPTPGRARW